jgi:ABC-type amino acid transport substrate-binding protein
MTTVGDGDKTPLTKFGRAFGVVWMFTALIIVASFIAAFSSILTLQNIASNVQGLNDLNHMRVATVPGSTSESFLHKHDITTTAFPTVKDSLAAVVRGDVDALVYDAPLLRYFTKIEFEGLIEVSPATFERQDYGFALPENSQLREPINRILLRVVRSEQWGEQLKHYLGE